MSLYDRIGAAYRAHDDSPQKTCALTPSLLELVGGTRGQKVLDIGCGSGYSSRIFARAGAAVTGIDISEQQIAAAERQERAHPLSIEYRVMDMKQFSVREVGGSFDVVTTYLSLHYATNREELERTIRNVSGVLKPGGVFAGIINNPRRPFGGSPTIGARAEPHQTKTPQDGDKIRIEIYESEKLATTFFVHHFAAATYERLLRRAGFEAITWKEPAPNREGVARYGAEVWKDPSTILFRCRKA